MVDFFGAECRIMEAFGRYVRSVDPDAFERWLADEMEGE